MTSRGAPGGGRRLGGGGGGGGPGGARKGVNALTRLLRRLVLAPAKAIRNAVDEGGPLVTHAGFAFACLALQRAMRANAPGGLLEKGGLADRSDASFQLMNDERAFRFVSF